MSWNKRSHTTSQGDQQITHEKEMISEMHVARKKVRTLNVAVKRFDDRKLSVSVDRLRR